MKLILATNDKIFLHEWDEIEDLDLDQAEIRDVLCSELQTEIENHHD